MDDLAQALAELSDHCDMLYLHIDSDTLDEAYVPNHGAKVPDANALKGEPIWRLPNCKLNNS